MSTPWKKVVAAQAGMATLVMTLIQTKSSECPTAFFVKPGDANASYLYQKINGTGSCFVGASMPLGAPLLTPKERGIIRDWINAGALPN